MAQLLRLEDFESDDKRLPAAPQVEDLPGYEAGYAAGLATAQADQRSVDAELVQSLNDMAFGFVEAQNHVLQSTLPLFRGLIEQLIPSIIDQSFCVRLVETLQDLATKRAKAPVRLIVHPDKIDSVAALLPGVNGIEIDLHHDTEIGMHGALISQGHSEFILDLDELIAEIRRILSAVIDQQTDKEDIPNNG